MSACLLLLHTSIILNNLHCLFLTLSFFTTKNTSIKRWMRMFRRHCWTLTWNPKFYSDKTWASVYKIGFHPIIERGRDNYVRRSPFPPTHAPFERCRLQVGFELMISQIGYKLSFGVNKPTTSVKNLSSHFTSWLYTHTSFAPVQHTYLCWKDTNLTANKSQSCQGCHVGQNP